MQPKERSARPQRHRHTRHASAQPPVQFVVPPDFSLAQRVALYPWICKERRAQRAIAQSFDAAPRAAQMPRIEHRMCEHDGCVAAIEKNFARQHTCPGMLREEKTLVSMGPPQSLEKHAHAHTRATARDTRRKRPSIGEPRPIPSAGDRRSVPRQILRQPGHVLSKIVAAHRASHRVRRSKL